MAPMSEKQKKFLSDLRKGKPLCIAHREAIGHGVKNSEKHKQAQKNKKCSGEDNPNWRPKIEYHCPVCDKVVLLTQTKFDGYTKGRISCSRKCGQDRKEAEGKTNKGVPNPECSIRMKENNPMKNPETAAKTSIALKKKWESGELEGLREIFRTNAKNRIGIPLNLSDKGRKSMSEHMINNNPMKDPEVAARVSAKLIENFANGTMIPPNPINNTRYNTGYFIDNRGRRVFYASGWELTRMEFLDSYGESIFWEKIKSSFRVPYTDKNGKKRTYFPDFYVVYNDIKIVEEVGDWMDGKEEKIEAAHKYFNIRNIKFVVLTRGTLHAETWL